MVDFFYQAVHGNSADIRVCAVFSLIALRGQPKTFVSFLIQLGKLNDSELLVALVK